MEYDCIKKILLVRTDGIGDALNSTPAISALRKTYPNAKISIVARPYGADILSHNPDIDEIIVYNPDKQHRGLTNKLRFFMQLWSRKFDIAIALQNSSFCNFITFVSGAKIRVGRKSEPKRFSSTLTHRISQVDPKGTKHEIDRNFDLLRLINVQNGTRDLVLRLSNEEKAFADKFLSEIPLDPPFLKGEDEEFAFSKGENKKASFLKEESKQDSFSEEANEKGNVSTKENKKFITERTENKDKIIANPLFRLVGIHPGGSSIDKMWLPENFALIADNLIEKFSARVMLFYGNNEDHLAEIILNKMKNMPILASKVSLRQLCALIERCSLFICNDSGPMHIASAFKIPTIAIFGPTDYIRWRPQHENAIVVRKDMDCFPCSAHKCKRNYECIKTIPVSQVWGAIVGLI